MAKILNRTRATTTVQTATEWTLNYQTTNKIKKENNMKPTTPEEEFISGQMIRIPEFEAILAHFGEENGLPKNQSIGFVSAMAYMCGKEHILLGINPAYKNALTFKDEITGNNFSFDRRIFTEITPEPVITYVGKDKEININETIMSQMIHRYELVRHDYCDGTIHQHGIIDTLYPYEKIANEKGKKSIMRGNPGHFAISEKIAKEFQIPQLDIADLISILGYTKTDIKKLMTSLKKKEFRICVIGYGGTGTNFLHWFSQLAILTNTTHHFRDLVLSDADYFDSVNLFRVPFILPELKANYIQPKVKYWIDYAHIAEDKYVTTKNISSKHNYPDYIHYGAPDLDTRQLLKDLNIPFIAATHRNEDCGLTLNPNLDTELMVETYGKISLTTFFLNHLVMTIEFIKFLAAKETTMGFLKGDEVKVLSYNFKEANDEFVKNGKTVNGKLLFPVTSEPYNIAKL